MHRVNDFVIDNTDYPPGHRIGHWEVLKKVVCKGYPGYLCLCDCGHTEEIFATRLYRGQPDRCYKCKIKRRTQRVAVLNRMRNFK